MQSRATLNEFVRVLNREKFRKIFQKRNITPEIIIEALISQSKFYDISKSSKAKAKKIKIADSDDRIFLELAFEVNARHIISGDKHLLDLKQVEGIEVLSVKDFLAL